MAAPGDVQEYIQFGISLAGLESFVQENAPLLVERDVANWPRTETYCNEIIRPATVGHEWEDAWEVVDAERGWYTSPRRYRDSTSGVLLEVPRCVARLFVLRSMMTHDSCCERRDSYRRAPCLTVSC